MIKGCRTREPLIRGTTRPAASGAAPAGARFRPSPEEARGNSPSPAGVIIRLELSELRRQLIFSVWALSRGARPWPFPIAGELRPWVLRPSPSASPGLSPGWRWSSPSRSRSMVRGTGWCRGMGWSGRWRWRGRTGMPTTERDTSMLRVDMERGAEAPPSRHRGRRMPRTLRSPSASAARAPAPVLRHWPSGPPGNGASPSLRPSPTHGQGRWPRPRSWGRFPTSAPGPPLLLPSGVDGRGRIPAHVTPSHNRFPTTPGPWPAVSPVREPRTGVDLRVRISAPIQWRTSG